MRLRQLLRQLLRGRASASAAAGGAEGGRCCIPRPRHLLRSACVAARKAAASATGAADGNGVTAVGGVSGESLAAGRGGRDGEFARGGTAPAAAGGSGRSGGNTLSCRRARNRTLRWDGMRCWGLLLQAADLRPERTSQGPSSSRGGYSRGQTSVIICYASAALSLVWRAASTRKLAQTTPACVDRKIHKCHISDVDSQVMPPPPNYPL